MPMLTVGTWKSNCHWADIRSQISISNNSAFPIFFVVWYHRKKALPHLCLQINLTWERRDDSVLVKHFFIDSRILSQIGIFRGFSFYVIKSRRVQ